MKDPAPLFTEAYDLSAWLLGRLDGGPDRLSREICALALDLLDTVTEGLRARDDPGPLHDADALLRRLRLRLRLAADIGLLDERRMLHALGRADTLGRQLGGLLRHRAGVHGPHPRPVRSGRPRPSVRTGHLQTT